MDIEVFKDSVVVFVRSNQAWAAPIVFLLAFGESLAFVSLVLPATVILVGIGGLIGVSGIDLWPVWCAGVVGSIVSVRPRLQHLPLDGGRFRRRRCAPLVATSSRAAVRRAG